MTAQEADKIIAEYMGRPMVSFFGASDDGGESCRFTDKSRAVVQHFLDDDPNGYHTDFKVVDWSYYFHYHESLDALVPVWEKLEIDLDEQQCLDLDIHIFIREGGFNLCGVTDHSEKSKPIQEAAAIATAKAIQELSNDG